MKKIILGTALAFAFATGMGDVDAKQIGHHRKNVKAAVAEFQDPAAVAAHATDIASIMHTATSKILTIAKSNYNKYKSVADQIDDICESASNKGTPKTTKKYADKARKSWTKVQNRSDVSAFAAAVNPTIDEMLQSIARLTLPAGSPVPANYPVVAQGLINSLPVTLVTMAAMREAFNILMDISAKVAPAVIQTVIPAAAPQSVPQPITQPQTSRKRVNLGK